MEHEWQPDSLIETRLNNVRQDLIRYIENNSEKIDTNIPVFYGHVVSLIENSLPEIDDKSHDQLIDEITIRVLNQSSRSSSVDYIEKLFNHAYRLKRKPGGKMIFDVILGLKMIDIGNYYEAIEQLKPFRKADAMIYTAIAYCYHVLSTEKASSAIHSHGGKTGDMALNAREQLIEMVRVRPPVNRLRFPRVAGDLRINKIFWYMLKRAIEWFPEEPEFLKIGLEKARMDGNQGMQGELLTIATERYYNDMVFLRELYSYRLEQNDAAGAAGVVKQMIQHYPDELEPVYHGMQLSMMLQQGVAYGRFRKMAIAKGMPDHVVYLLDFAFELMSGKRAEASSSLEKIRQRLSTRNHYLTLIEYMTEDVFSDDTGRARKARATLLDSIDQYCLRLVKMKE